MIIAREEDLNVMDGGSSGYVQCQQCGAVHTTKMKIDIENNLYTELKCPKCRGVTQHLWCGDTEDDVYLYYNPVTDSRFYEYNTK